MYDCHIIAHPADNPKIVRNHNDRHVELILKLVIRSRICACMVTSSAVVGSSAIRRLGLHESAMAIIARCLMPPLIWWGYSFALWAGLRNSYLVQHVDGHVPSFFPCHILMQKNSSSTDNRRCTGIQRRHGLLKYHRYLIAPDVPHDRALRVKTGDVYGAGLTPVGRIRPVNPSAVLRVRLHD